MKLVDFELEKRIQELFKARPQRDPYRRFTILAYQLADVGKSMRYSLIYPADRDAHRAYLKTALSDLLIQVLIMARLLGYDPDELLKLGVPRLDEYLKKGDYVEEINEA
jgi:hypothetical protein